MIDATKYTAHKHPGKFEGETPATEYFYDLLCNGDDGEPVYAGDPDELDAMFDGACAHLFQINAAEAEAFGLECGHWFLLREDSQGFALGSVHESREAAEQKFRNWIGA